MYGDGGGLWLQVTGQGAKSWIFRFTLRGKSRAMGLGSANTFSLAEARDKALACRKRCAEGLDPIEVRHAQRQDSAIEAARAMSFRQCATAYIEAHRASRRNTKHAARPPRLLRPKFQRTRTTREQPALTGERSRKEANMRPITTVAIAAAAMAFAGAAYAQAPAGTVAPAAPVVPPAGGVVAPSPGTTGNTPNVTIAPGGTGASTITTNPAQGSNAGQPARPVPQGSGGSGTGSGG